ncbi:MAG: hypothetical protein ACOX6X_02215 [Dethiobacteria bacterium]|jgi:SLT domain-containing protein
MTENRNGPYVGRVTYALKPDYGKPVIAQLILKHNNYPLSGYATGLIDNKTIIFQPGEENRRQIKVLPITELKPKQDARFGDLMPPTPVPNK